MQQSEAAEAERTVINKTVSKSNAAHFFMSANTPSGYISKFSELYNAKSFWKAYILKSAPGAASPILEEMGKKFEKAHLNVEYIHCVLQPKAIGAIVLPDLKCCIIDGMPPHCIEPSFPGVIEQEIMLCEPNTEILFDKSKDILQFTARATSLYDRVYRFLSAAASLQNDIFNIASESIDTEAIIKYVTGLSKRLFPQKSTTGTVYKRYLTGITSDGILSFYKNNSSSYSRVYAIEDEYGIGCILLDELQKRAVKAGYNVYSCICPILAESQALFIPSLSLAFVTSNSHHRAEGKSCRHINIKRFTDYDTLRLKKARIGFNRRASRELYEQAISLLSEAKASDDIVLDCYKPSVDFEIAKEKALDLAESIINSI